MVRGYLPFIPNQTLLICNMNTKSQKLNLGCGSRFVDDWINVDIVPTDPSVIKMDFRSGLIYKDNSIDVIYISHVIEHFSLPDAFGLLKECLRVLKPLGIIRVVVPDLENIARLYLECLDGCKESSDVWSIRRERMFLEMYDQCIREKSGGEMQKFLDGLRPDVDKYILDRIDFSDRQKVVGKVKDNIDILPSIIVDNNPDVGEYTSIFAMLVNYWHIITTPWRLREGLLRRLLGDEYTALQVGRFRSGGEIHKCMYDEYSLSNLLQSVGIVKIVSCDPNDSRIPSWSSYNLECADSGALYKPGSLYIEGCKE